MRLRAPSGRLPLLSRFKLGLLWLVTGWRTPDILLTLHYKASFFGRPFSDLLQDVMRGPSSWSVGERELFAAFVSRQNQCPF